MPTGYTAKIKEGQTFNEFILGCARAFGALIEMRDEPGDAVIPESFAPSNYHNDKRKLAEVELIEIRNMSAEEVKKAAKLAYLDAKEDYDSRARERNELKKRYAAMLVEVTKWEPPTPDHQGLKEFMVQQLSESIKFDCYEYEPPIEQSADDWYKDRLSASERSVAYHREEYRKEIERAGSRSEWLKKLRDSLPPQQ